MTIGELISRLRQWDPSTPLFVKGYEGGVDDLKKVVVATIARDVNLHKTYMGDHEPIIKGYQFMDFEDHEQVCGLIIK